MENNKEIVFTEHIGNTLIYSSNQKHNMVFTNAQGNKVGEFDFTGGVCSFKGDCDESAEIFVDLVLRILENDYIIKPKGGEDGIH